MGRKGRGNIDADLSRQFKGLSCSDSFKILRSEDLNTLVDCQRSNYDSDSSDFQGYRDRSFSQRNVYRQNTDYERTIRFHQPRQNFDRKVHQSHSIKPRDERWRTNTVDQETLTVSEVRDAVEENLMNWGLNKLNAMHSTFIDSVKILAVNDLKWYEKVEGKKMEEISDLPQEMEDAMKFVLDSGLRNSKDVYYDVEDVLTEVLGEKIPFPPYFLNSRSERIMKKQFISLTSRRYLDPFVRFKQIQYSKKEYWRRLFFDEEMKGCLDGIIFEAIVTSYAIHDKRVSCKSCRSNSSFKWMGLKEHPWMDFVCTKCNSTYEVKTKQDERKVLNHLLKYKNVNGGSFRGFYDLKRKSKCHLRAKHYIVMVGREITAEIWVDCKKIWNVYVTEIDKVLPEVHAKHFVRPIDKIHLKSKIWMKPMMSERPWFSIPHFHFDPLQIARTTFDSHF